MRQLVSVVDETSVRVYLNDGDETAQIAMLMNPGLNVEQVVELGTGLGQLFKPGVLGSNGNGHKRDEALPVAKPAALKPAAKKRTPRQYTRHALTIEQIAAWVAEHPGALIAEVADALAPASMTDRSARRSLIDNRIRPHMIKCQKDGTPVLVRQRVDGEGRMRAWPGG